MERILVLGGTGTLGAPVVGRLALDGFAVRVLARDPEGARRSLGDDVDVVRGDVTDRKRLRIAMEGCDGVHASIGGPAEQAGTETAAELAGELGLRRIVYVSGTTVCEENGWYPLVAQKLAGEHAVKNCGVPWTVLRPTWVMEQLPRFVQKGRPMVIGRIATPYHWFAARDMARMVSTALRNAEAVGKVLFIHGPEAITVKDALERFCRVQGIDKEAKVMPIWLAKGLGIVTRNPMLRYAAGLMGYFIKVAEPGDPAEANRLLGAPETTLEEWVAWRSALAGR